MHQDDDALFDVNVWKPALQKYSAVTHLTVTLYDVDERVVCCGSMPSTPFVALFEEYGYAPEILIECARRCLAQGENREPVIVAPGYGVAVVGTSLALDGKIVGAAVAGYALVDLTRTSTIERLARHAGVPLKRLWDVARQQQPIPPRRLVLHGELLQVLGDTILRENDRTRKLETEMAAKDEFLAVLSHELRTPLTPILGWVRILKEAGDDPAQRLKAADSIERNALLQIKLVDDLLDLNRVIRDKVPIDIGVHDLVDLVRSALDTMAEVVANKKIDMACVCPSESLPVEGDAVRLQQVFVNVLSNAVKFTPPGGRIRVTVERASDTAFVRVVDTGEGISAKFLPHVFEMFGQQEQGTRRRHSGLGIGLALVKRLVEMHGGHVDIASAGAGSGTEVMIRLPVTERALDAREGLAKVRIGSRPFDDLTILVVEDTEDSLDATRIMLEVLGADVLVARNGVEALDVMAMQHPDLVLCDLRMPEMDGFEFLRELWRIQGDRHPPVVAVSGLVSPADHERTQAAGFEGHLDKPFDDAALVTAVRKGLSQLHSRRTTRK
jgi:signal transduction histidine kinase/ActR/RegA family two-component response regulator